MTREAFIRKWLANKDFQYCEDGRAQMREDLDKVIEHAQQPPTIASVSGKLLLDEIDELLAVLEDYIHGQHGNAITEMRGRIKAACASGAVDTGADEEKNVGRDWQEDFAHENGNYQNKCTRCGELFIGHKRRPLCKICVYKQMPHYK